MRAYTLGISGFANRSILDALGEPRHIRQAASVIVASSKKHAAELAATYGFGRVSLSDDEFRMLSTPDMHPVTRGLLTLANGRPMVFAYSMNSGDGSAVVAVDESGPWVAGHLRRVDGRETFVPLDGVA